MMWIHPLLLPHQRLPFVILVIIALAAKFCFLQNLRSEFFRMSYNKVTNSLLPQLLWFPFWFIRSVVSRLGWLIFQVRDNIFHSYDTRVITFLAAFLIGAVASFIGSMVGGGGLLSIPFLVFVGLPPQVAIATNKMGAIGLILGAIPKFWKAKKRFSGNTFLFLCWLV